MINIHAREPELSTSIDPGAEHTARIGSLEHGSSLARKLMPRIHPPGARVAVIVSAEAARRRICAWLNDEVTAIVCLQSLSELEHLDDGLDVIIIARAMLDNRDLTLRRVRQRRLTATLIVTDAHDVLDVGHLLDAGADDAIPSDSPILACRLHAAARRARAVNASIRIAIGDIVYDRDSHRVWCGSGEVHLTRTEESLLDCLFWYMPRPASMDDLTAFVWHGEVTAESRNLVHVYVRYLRRKLGMSKQVVIQTLRGTGYKLAAR